MPKSSKIVKPASSVVWFEIPADNPERAQKFYRSLFGWNIKQFPGRDDYWHIETDGPDASPDGGMIVRKHETQPITAYISVPSVARAVRKIRSLGGTVCMEETAVQGMGYFAICRDTENNEFAVWEMSEKAK